MSRRASTLAFVFAACASAGVAAEEHVIEGAVTQWRPLVLFAQPGDTVRFKNMTGHDTETIAGMLPEGAEGWKSQLGEEGFSVKLDKEGAYVYKCNPHISTGMVGVIVAGDARPPVNRAALDTGLDNVKVGKNRGARVLQKLDQALAEGL